MAVTSNAWDFQNEILSPEPQIAPDLEATKELSQNFLNADLELQARALQARAEQLDALLDDEDAPDDVVLDEAALLTAFEQKRQDGSRRLDTELTTLRGPQSGLARLRRLNTLIPSGAKNTQQGVKYWQATSAIQQVRPKIVWQSMLALDRNTRRDLSLKISNACEKYHRKRKAHIHADASTSPAVPDCKKPKRRFAFHGRPCARQSGLFGVNAPPRYQPRQNGLHAAPSSH